MIFISIPFQLFTMSSPQKRGTSLLPEDNSNYEEAQYDDFSSITTRAAAKCKMKYFDVFQQVSQLSPNLSISKEKKLEYNLSSSMISNHRLDRLEIMMKRLLEIVQVLAKANSRHSSLQTSSRFSPRIIPKTHEFSKNHSTFHIDSQD